MTKSTTTSPEVADFLELKKSIHVCIPYTVINNIREILEDEGGQAVGLSVQAVLAEVATRLSFGDQYMLDLVRFLRQRHNEKNFSIAKTDLDDLFSILERESPLSAENRK